MQLSQHGADMIVKRWSSGIDKGNRALKLVKKFPIPPLLSFQIWLQQIRMAATPLKQPPQSRCWLLQLYNNDIQVDHSNFKSPFSSVLGYLKSKTQHNPRPHHHPRPHPPRPHPPRPHHSHHPRHYHRHLNNSLRNGRFTSTGALKWFLLKSSAISPNDKTVNCLSFLDWKVSLSEVGIFLTF